VREIREQCGPKRRVDFVGAGTTNRVDAEIEVAQGHGQRISYLVRDDAGWRRVPQRLSGRDPAPRTLLGCRNGSEDRPASSSTSRSRLRRSTPVGGGAAGASEREPRSIARRR